MLFSQMAHLSLSFHLSSGVGMSDSVAFDQAYDMSSNIATAKSVGPKGASIHDVRTEGGGGLAQKKM